MKPRTILLLYQLLTGVSDTATGLLLMVAPAFTLRLMHVPVPAEALPFLSYVGVFVFSVGMACLYGAKLSRGQNAARLETVWLLTAITRGLVAMFVAVQVAEGVFDPAWSSVAVTDGLLAILQTVGLARGWPADGLR